MDFQLKELLCNKETVTVDTLNIENIIVLCLNAKKIIQTNKLNNNDKHIVKLYKCVYCIIKKSKSETFINILDTIDDIIFNINNSVIIYCNEEDHIMGNFYEECALSHTIIKDIIQQSKQEQMSNISHRMILLRCFDCLSAMLLTISKNKLSLFYIHYLYIITAKWMFLNNSELLDLYAYGANKLYKPV